MAFRSFICALLLFVAEFCYSQQNQVDSLENLIKTTSNDTTKVWLLNRLVTTLREGDNNKALTYARQARELAQVLNYQNGLAWALENLGWLSYRKGDYSTAFQLATDALAILEKSKDHSAISRCLNSIAAIYYEQRQYDAALTNFKKGLYAAKQSNDLITIARSLNNIAFTLLHLNKEDSAKIFAERGLLASQKAKSKYLEGYAFRTLGDIDLREQNIEAALKKFSTTVQLADKVQNKFLKSSTLHRVAK